MAREIVNHCGMSMRRRWIGLLAVVLCAGAGLGAAALIVTRDDDGPRDDQVRSAYEDPKQGIVPIDRVYEP
jgi:hypothetical protein